MSLTKWFGQREAFSEEPDYFVYADLPSEFRIKIMYRLRAALDDIHTQIFNGYRYPPEDFYSAVKESVLRALGRLDLGQRYAKPQVAVEDFLRECSVEEFFVLLENFLELIQILGIARDGGSAVLRLLETEIQAFNTLALWHKVGYEIIDVGEQAPDDVPRYQVIRKDTQYLHVETIRRPLTLLQTPGFELAQRQFVDALDEYAKGNYADAVTDANSSFEGVMKQILGTDKGTASQLIAELCKRGYFPGYMQKDAVALGDLIETLPKLRDNTGDAHGRLSIEEDQLARYAKFAIHLCGSYIVFLVDEYLRRKAATQP